MPIILSLGQHGSNLWAAGPEGLFQVNDGELTVVAQPQAELACCAVTDSNILVGGAPHGVAFTPDSGSFWQAAWMDGVAGPILCMVVDPKVDETGVVLAGSAEGGILRSTNRGQSWSVCNFGLQEYTVLTLAWAPSPPADRWPKWDVVFAGTEAGLYRSPNGGLGWRHVDGFDAVAQVSAVSPNFHEDGLVLVGTENDGLWRSSDGGQSFAKVESAPSRIDALAAVGDGWMLSDEQALWKSADGFSWTPVKDSLPALFMIADEGGVWCAGEQGVRHVGAAG